MIFLQMLICLLRCVWTSEWITRNDCHPGLEARFGKRALELLNLLVVPVPGVAVDSIPGLEAGPVRLIRVKVLMERRCKILAGARREQERPCIRPNVLPAREEVRGAFHLPIKEPELIQPTRVGVDGRRVADVTIQIHIPRGVADGVEAGPAAEGGGVVAEAEVVQAARRVVPAALVQVEPADGACSQDVPAGVEDRRLAEGAVGVAFDDVARIVKERHDIIVGVLGNVQAFVQRAVAVRVPVALVVVDDDSISA